MALKMCKVYRPEGLFVCWSVGLWVSVGFDETVGKKGKGVHPNCALCSWVV